MSTVDSTALPRRTPPRARRAGATHRYHALLERAPFGLGILTAEGRWQAGNEALIRLLGWDTVADLPALLPGDFYRDPADHQRLLAALSGDRPTSAVELRWRRRDGAPLMVRVGGVPIETTDGTALGQPTAFEVLVENVTERWTLEERLRQAQKMEAIGQLTSGIAHDFNNILTIVLANAELLAEGIPPEKADLRADLEDLRRAARRGADMIAKLMSFSRHGELRLQRHDAGQVVRDLGRTLRRLLPETIRLAIETDPGEPLFVQADVTALQQVLLNLATNARDAMPQGGKLTIRVARRLGRELPGSVIQLSVEDSGTGMDAETCARLFEPFFTSKPAGQGTGLGLAMVHGIVRQHHGAVIVESAPGVGTTIQIEFPEATGEVAAVPAPDNDSEPRPRRSEGRILIAEDEEVIRRSAKRVLERQGYTVMRAADGAEALHWLVREGQTTDLVITDLIMPKLGGLELYRAARAAGITSQFLFTSGYLRDDARHALEADSHLAFLPKPWTAAELLAKVQRLLAPE